MTIKRLADMADDLSVRREPPVTHYLSTGCTILDLAIADRLPGGFGAGRVNHIWGGESSSKSVLVAEVLASVQRQKGQACLVDAESTFDLDRAERLHNLDIDKLVHIMPDAKNDLTIEYLFDNIITKRLDISLKNVKSLDLLAIDSLSAIPSGMELEKGIEGKSYSPRARELSTAFRSYIWKLSKANLTLLFVDQTRQKIGVQFGEKDTRSGGKALDFYASTRVKTKVFGKIKNKFDKVIGVDIEFSVDKNKIAPPFRSGIFSILFDYGIDDIGTNIQFLGDYSKTQKINYSKGYYYYNNKQWRFAKLIEYIEKEGKEEELQQEVHRVWKIIHVTTERKPRVR